jgi:hypothetical protein
MCAVIEWGWMMLIKLSGKGAILCQTQATLGVQCNNLDDEVQS